MAPGWWPFKKNPKSPSTVYKIPRAQDSSRVNVQPPPINIDLPSPPSPSRTGVVRAVNQSVQQRTRLIIGLDYGTSHSGGAWTLFNPEADPQKTDITTIRGWPGNQTGDYTASKVSSEISYDGNRVRWGFDIPGDSKRLRWVKLLLEPEPKLQDMLTGDTLSINESREQLKRDGRTEIDAASDYLACLWKHTKAQIIAAITQPVFDFAEKTIVLTIPAVWSPKARHNSYLVAVNAGLTDPSYSLRIVTEPESAAIAVLKDKPKTFEVGDCFVVCDAGGGTVDLTSYQVEKLEPLCLKERVVGDGGLCGSVFLDMAFKRYLRTIITEEIFDKINPRHMAKMMHEFESCIKRQFSYKEDRSYIFDLLGVHSQSETEILLTRDNLIPIFDAVCNDIEELIYKQIKDLREQGILANLEAVSTGAVLCELLGAGNVVDVHLSRINIGIKCNELYREGYHLPEDKFFCKYVQMHKAKNQVVWFVYKGDGIKTGGKSIFPFTRIYGVKALALDSKVQVKAHLVRSSEDKTTTRRTSAVHNFVTIRFNVDRGIFDLLPQRVNENGELFWFIDYEVEMTMGPAELQFSCIINGVVQDSTSIVYHTAGDNE